MSPKSESPVAARPLASTQAPPRAALGCLARVIVGTTPLFMAGCDSLAANGDRTAVQHGVPTAASTFQPSALHASQLAASLDFAAPAKSAWGAKASGEGAPSGPSPSEHAAAGCVKGWSTPPRGGPLRKAALDMMRVQAGERFVVDELRYFLGPEDAEVLGPPREVERWYVKAYTETEPRRRQRWLVRRAAVGTGVDAVAPYDSTGYGPDTWKRLDVSDESLADPFQRPCQSSEPGAKCMGLPREVLGCLEGT